MASICHNVRSDTKHPQKRKTECDSSMCLPYRTRVKKERKRTRWRSINSADQPPPPTRNQHESISVASCPPHPPLPTLSLSLLLLSHWRPLKATVVFIWTASISKANKEYKLSRQPAVDNMQHQPPPVRPAGPTLFPFYRSSCFLFPFVHFLELFVFSPAVFPFFFTIIYSSKTVIPTIVAKGLLCRQFLLSSSTSK